MSIFNPHNKTARPLGSSPIRSVRGMGALGAGVASSIPGQCWDVTGFKDCHAQWFAQAQKDCQSGEVSNFDGDMDACTDVYADQYAMQNCVPKYCPSTIPTKQVGGLTAAQVMAIQKTVNTQLAANGYKTIGVDGKLGPATCGAALWMQQLKISTIYTDNNLSLYCTTFVNPTRVGKTVPEQTVQVPEINASSTTAPLTFPAWGAQDPSIPPLQSTLNRNLDAQGYLMIPASGMLDAPTCGAMQWLKANTGQDFLTASGPNCQSFTAPKKKPASLSPANAPKGSPPPVVAPPAPTPPGTHPITSATMLMGGLALAAAGGLYYYAKKKGMV